MRNLRSLCCAVLLLTLGSAYAEKSDEAGMVKSSRKSGIPSTFVPDPQGSGYMLAFPMDESGIVAAESAPQVAQVVLPEGAAEAIVEEAKKEGVIPADATPVSTQATEEKKEEVPSTQAPSTPKPTTTTTKAPYKPPSEADRRRKIEEMRKILGLPPTGTKPKYVPPEKPKSILPTLLLKAALPKLHNTHSRLAEMLPIPLSLMRRSDSGSDSQGAGPRIAVLSNILQTASAFMRRAILEDEADVQNVRGGKRNPKSKNSIKDEMMMLLDDDKLKNILSGDKDDDDDDDDLPFLPFPRPFPVPFRLPFGRGGSPPQMPFGLPRHPSMGPMGPHRMPPMIQSRSFPRIPMHPSQYPPRPVPFHQPMMMPQPFHFQSQHPMHAQSGPVFAPYHQPQQQILLVIPQRAPQPPPQHVQFVPQHYPVPMAHPSMHYDQMQAASHHVPSPVQPVLVMLHPMAVPQHMYRPQVQFRQPPSMEYRHAPSMEYRHAPNMEYRNAPDDEIDERELGNDSNEGPQESPRFVMLVDNSVGPSPRGMPQFPQPRANQAQIISPLRKMQIIREIIMARQSAPSGPRSPIMASHSQGNSIFPFHPPVPRLVPKMMAELRQKTGERLAASMLRPIFLPAGL